MEKKPKPNCPPQNLGDDNNTGITVSVREYIERIIDERTQLNDIRFKALEAQFQAAVAAQAKATEISFAASEKAVLKAEEAQKDYNQRSNEFRGQLDDQAKTLMPRTEAMALFSNNSEKFDLINKELANLRESRSEVGGKFEGAHTLWTIAIAGFGMLLGLASLFMVILRR